jgi:hypothetical protein
VNLDGVIFFNGAPIGAGVARPRRWSQRTAHDAERRGRQRQNNTTDGASVILGGTARSRAAWAR